MINAKTITGSSTGSTQLTGSGNTIGILSTFTSNGFGLNDTTALSVTGAVNAGTGPVRLTTTGTGSNVSISNNLTTSSTGGIIVVSAG